MTKETHPHRAKESDSVLDLISNLRNLVVPGDTEGMNSMEAFIAQQREAIGSATERWKTSRELLQAKKRLGETSREWMEWLIRFSQDDINAMTVGDFLNLQFSLLAISNFSPPQPDGNASVPHLLASVEGFFIPSKTTAETFQSWVRQTLGAILQKDDSKAPPVPPLQLRMLYDKNHPPHWRLGEQISSSYAPRYALLLLITRYADQVQRCPECNTIFLAETGKQEYCSKRCQAKVAKRRYREKDPNYVPGRKRGRPRKEEQATTKTTAATKTIKTKGRTDGRRNRS